MVLPQAREGDRKLPSQDLVETHQTKQTAFRH